MKHRVSNTRCFKPPRVSNTRCFKPRRVSNTNVSNIYVLNHSFATRDLNHGFETRVLNHGFETRGLNHAFETSDIHQTLKYYITTKRRRVERVRRRVGRVRGRVGRVRGRVHAGSTLTIELGRSLRSSADTFRIAALICSTLTPCLLHWLTASHCGLW